MRSYQVGSQTWELWEDVRKARLAAAPVQQPLTDAQLAELIPDDADGQFVKDPAGFIRRFARAIEAHIKGASL
jgi:hypothetical protein